MWFDLDISIRLVVALVCGFAIGLERQVRGKAAGARTCALICIGTMVFVHLGTVIGGDKGRALGQVITGIGFLGAGSIMKQDTKIVGLTSAAVVWMVAAIGSTIAVAQYGLAITLTVMTICILSVMQRVEDWFEYLIEKD